MAEELNEKQIHFLPAGGAYEHQWYTVSWVTAVNKAELLLMTSTLICIVQR